MFQPSAPSTQLNLFSNLYQQLPERKVKRLQDEHTWESNFFREITSRIPEQVFAPMYSHTGRPSSPIRLLVAMRILKEGQKWSDEQLFENCGYNILLWRALGLNNVDDKLPSPATYYNFWQMVSAYDEQTGVNLLTQVFEQLTKDQVIRFQVNGRAVRMDSKLVESNIAKATRLQLCLGILAKFYKSLSGSHKAHLSASQQTKLNQISEQTPNAQTYGLTSAEAIAQLKQLGSLLYQLVVLYQDLSSEAYQMLQRLWEEHFELKVAQPTPSACEPKLPVSETETETETENNNEIEIEIEIESNKEIELQVTPTEPSLATTTVTEQTSEATQDQDQDQDEDQDQDQDQDQDEDQSTVEMLTLKDKKQLKGSNIQSPHDPDATHRIKTGSKKQTVTGYAINITETCTPSSQYAQKEQQQQQQQQTAKALNLITHVDVKPATHSDDKFFEPAIEKSQAVLQDEIQVAFTDGAYNSQANQAFAQQQDTPIKWYLTGIQGKPGKYDFRWEQDQQTYEVTNKITGESYLAHRIKSGNYRIRENVDNSDKPKSRYFKPHNIANYFRRKQIANLPKWVRAARANVEASIHQVFGDLNGDQTKYRGLFKHQTYALSRCIWTNFQRINDFMTQ